MAITIELKKNRLPQFDFRLPFPQTPIDHLHFRYEMEKVGNALLLSVNIDYALEDFDTKEKYEVTKFRSVYEITPKGEMLTAQKLYPVCKDAAGVLNHCLQYLVDCSEIPPKSVYCPPICHLQDGLQDVVHWYLAH
jgi:hypothetical protein